jgi:hypothetical protein
MEIMYFSNSKYVTAKRGDRIGMKIYGILWTKDFCEKNNLIYVHTPLPKPFENMFNFGYGCPSIHQFKKNEVTVFTKQTNLLNLSANGLIDNFCEGFRNNIIEKYNPANKSFEEKNKLKICIHVRRGDTEALNEDQYTLRHVEDDYIDNVLNSIHKKITKPFKIHIHSDGVLDMSRYNTHGMEIKTCFNDTKIEDVMRDMISCDILFRKGISSFSGVCSFYNTNLVVSDMPMGFENLYKQKNVLTLSDFLGQ